MEKKQDDFRFAGFDTPRYTPTPDQIFDELLAPNVLTEAELRVLLYIVRRTFGWKKDRDEISLSQITGGITKKDGTRLDWGAGVAKSSAVRAIKGLVAKDIIRATRNFREDGGSDVTTFSLHMRGTGSFTQPPSPPTDSSSSSRRQTPIPTHEQAEHEITNADEAKVPVFHGRTREGSGVEHGGLHDETGGSFTVKQVGSQNGTGVSSAEGQALVAPRNPQESFGQDIFKQDRDDSNQHSHSKISRKRTKPDKSLYSTYIAEVASDFSNELGDSEQLISNVTQALRIWEVSGLSEEEFVELMYDAKRRTRLYQGKNGLKGIENKMGYFFQVLRRLLDEPNPL